MHSEDVESGTEIVRNKKLCKQSVQWELSRVESRQQARQQAAFYLSKNNVGN